MRMFVAFLLMLAPTFAQAPDEVTPLLKQGETLIHAGQLVQAQEFFENAQRKFPDNADISFDLGTAFFLQHNWQKAIENFQKILLVKPNQTDALFYLAQAYYQNSDLARARVTIARAAELTPDNPYICQKYGEYLATTNNGEEDQGREGIKWLKKARSLNPNLERIDYDLGMTELSEKDIPDAAASFEEALKKDPANGKVAFLLAETRSLMGEWEKAHDELHAALVAACDSPRLMELQRRLQDQHLRYRRLIVVPQVGHGVHVEEHERLVGLVLARDADAAAGLIESHMMITVDALESAKFWKMAATAKI